MTFHHGSETERVNGGSVPVSVVDSAITGIVGTAPMGAVNELTVCLTKKDFARFGTILGQGFTLPDAFDILSRYASGKVYVVNVLDPTKHRTEVRDEILTLDQTTLTARTQKQGLLSLNLTAEGRTLNEGQDYQVDTQTGEIAFKALHTDLKATYVYADPTKVTEDDIKGGVDSLTGKRKGFELLRDGFNLYGADAKILICPGFDKTASCAAALATLADQMHAKAYIQLPQGTSLSKAIQGRGPLGTINASASNENVRHFFPYAIGTNNSLESLATHAAGLRMLIDVEKGYWFSTSNKELKGVIGMEIPLTARVDDKQSETNLLNAVGITTIFNSFGTGFRLWGNRSSNFPTVTHISNFEVASRTGDIIDESIRQAELQYIDLPIDDALLDSFIETLDTFLRSQKSLVGYSVGLDHEYDLVDAFSRGQIPLIYDYTPKIPGERITNKSVMTRKYLANLVSQR
ncbi:phage tail sheath family protein [Pasteurella multocida]|uniref:phage tail sheath family protein n=1 Tax=Pasteurella multocida TaxID=747 RepID=UPI002301D81D|nr:phage tail sheath subtilisin-like domain-containing protein [Pasteurella multocida]MDA5607070.1 phage tail sheath subtilisin-like domain-containing protein [Pasteurella multocida subsp. multocida]MDA5614667.1 phage tail sheath subtilisin-like domain-containing protein [Pasteurella multocida]MDA5624610.1 phage tail sheath subtilisin-like domain-containing protein [Pasteurella multocida]